MPRLRSSSFLPRPRALAFALCGAVWLVATLARAGDPELRWYTLTTQNFRIHYHGGLEEHAQRTAQVAEQLQKRLVGWLGQAPGERTEIVLTDFSDSSNGMANVLPYSAITLYVTAPDDLSVLNDYDDWLPTLVSHEQTHIVHLNTVSGLPELVSSVLGKQTAPNQLQPHWLIEGLAVYAESRLSSAGRLRSSMFDMYLRADVLEDNFATIDQISHAPRRWPGATLWYLYGSKFVEFIANLYGESVFGAIAAEAGDDVVPFGVNRQLRKVTGRTYPELYAAFKTSAQRKYAAQLAVVDARGRREGHRLTSHGRNTNSPRFVPKPCSESLGLTGPSVLYYRDDGHDTAGFATLPLVGDGHAAKLVSRSSGGAAAFTPDCQLLFQSSAPSQRLYYFNDLFLQQRGTESPRGWEGGRVRLTQGRRARDPDVSHDGKHVAYVTDRAGTTTLRVAHLTSQGRLEQEQALVPAVTNEQVFTPRFSPDDRYIAYGVWTRGGYRDLRIYDRVTNANRSLWRDRAVDQEPSWSPDGRYLYFSSDRTGISNIYAWEIATEQLSQVTNVATGAFMPEVSPDGQTLIYVGYNSGGFDLYSIQLAKETWLAPLEPQPHRDDRMFLEERGHTEIAGYNPLPTLRPRALVLDYRNDGTSQQLIASISGSDAVGLHSVSASAITHSGNSQPDLYASYGYSGFREWLFTNLSRTTDPNVYYRYASSSAAVRRVRTSATTGVQVPLLSEFSSQWISAAYVVSHLDAQLPTGTVADPYAPVPVEPFRGFSSAVRINYQFSNVEQYAYSVSAERGLVVNLSMSRADRYLGSQLEGSSAFAHISSYHPMPYAKHHVLALGTTLAASSGRAEGNYALGGYQDSPLLTSILNGAPQSRLTLRGYPSGQFQGSRLLLLQSEYRFPLAWVDRGMSTLPAFLRGISGAFGVDYGGAFSSYEGQKLSNYLRLGLAAELWATLTFGYGLNVQLALGYAHGMGAGAIAGGTSYLVVNSGL